MGVSLEDIKKLKELTGVGLTDAKTALIESDGNFDKALEAMRKKGLTRAEKKSDREAREGIIESYVHSGRIGVVLELNCETDFVARLDDLTSNDIPTSEYDRVKSEKLEAIKNEGKPADMAEKIVEGQLKKHFAEQVLLSQAYILDDSKTVQDHIKEAIAKLGENIVVGQFKRIELGVNG